MNAILKAAAIVLLFAFALGLVGCGAGGADFAAYGAAMNGAYQPAYYQPYYYPPPVYFQPQPKRLICTPSINFVSCRQV